MQIPLVHANPFTWPIKGCTADLPAMLGSQFGAEVPRRMPERSRPGKLGFDLVVVASGFAWGLPSLLLSGVLELGSNSITRRIEQQALRQAPFGTEARTLRWGGIEWEGTDQFNPSSMRVSAFEGPAVGVCGFADRIPPGTRITPEQGCMMVATQLLGIDPRGARPAVRQRTARGIDWTEHRFDDVAVGEERMVVAIRAATVDARLAVHWAAHPVELPYDIGPGFERLLDSVRISPLPAEGREFMLELGDGWMRRPPEKEGTLEAEHANGDTVFLQVSADPVRYDEAELEKRIRAILKSRMPEGAAAEFLGMSSCATSGNGRVFDYTPRYPEAGGIRHEHVRCMLSSGWIYDLVVGSQRGEAALPDLGVAADSLGVR